MTTVTDPVGTTEVAAMFDVQVRTVSMWRHRGQFPEPAAHVSGTPMWQRADVISWAEMTGKALAS